MVCGLPSQTKFIDTYKDNKTSNYLKNHNKFWIVHGRFLCYVAILLLLVTHTLRFCSNILNNLF